jgi:hypothetical protein
MNRAHTLLYEAIDLKSPISTVMDSYESFDIAGLFGSILIGCFITCVLFGVTTAQVKLAVHYDN